MDTKAVINRIRIEQDYECLFNSRDNLNSLGKLFLKGRKSFVKNAFVMGFELGYDHQVLEMIL